MLIVFVVVAVVNALISPCRPLHIAARNGLATVVQVLLSRGAAVMAVDEEGKSRNNYFCVTALKSTI